MNRGRESFRRRRSGSSKSVVRASQIWIPWPVIRRRRRSRVCGYQHDDHSSNSDTGCHGLTFLLLLYYFKPVETMRISPLLFALAQFLIYPAVITTVLLYFFPLFTGCEFPPTSKPQTTCYLNGSQTKPSAPSTVAPFRLLAFGDPQLEGDTSLPDPNAPFFPSLFRLDHLRKDGPIEYNYQVLKTTAEEVIHLDIPRIFQMYRKKLDLLGNDYYLAHIYRGLHWWLQPTHTAVLGDLLGSQWISDGEFDKRADRFWNRVFRHGTRVEDEIVNGGAGRVEVLGEDERWSRRILTVPGNHDVGYAGDMTRERMDRFERQFGKTNWDITFTLPENESARADTSMTDKVASLFTGASETPSIRIFSINSMNLDGPVYDSELQTETYEYINNAISRSPSVRTSKNTLNIILTHVPLHKPAGVCADGPYFTYHEGGGVREQNHLSSDASAPILEGILGKSSNSLTPGGGLGRNGFIIAGHDHVGCDTWHFADPDTQEWSALNYHSPAGRRQRRQENVAGVRELTLRAMMGSYGGFAFPISAWFDAEEGEWRFDVRACQAGVQHIWWGVHVLDLVTIGCFLGGIFSAIVEEISAWRQHKRLEAARLRGRSKSISKSRSQTPGSRRSKSRTMTPSVNGDAKHSVKLRKSGSMRRRRPVEG